MKVGNSQGEQTQFDCWVNPKILLIIFLHIMTIMPLPKGSDEIIKRLQMWLNYPQYGHK